MAVADLKVLKSRYGVQRFRTEAAVTAGFSAGDGIIMGGTGRNYASLVLTGDPENGTDIFLGVSRSTATNTASADGVVDVEICGPGTVLEGRATTAANINTDALLLVILNDYVAFDRSAATAAGVLTIDEDEGDDPNVHGLCILDGDIVKGTLRVAPAISMFYGNGI